MLLSYYDYYCDNEYGDDRDYDENGYDGDDDEEGMEAKPVQQKAAAGGPKEDMGDITASHQAWGHLDGTENWRIEGMDDNPGVFLMNVNVYPWLPPGLYCYQSCLRCVPPASRPLPSRSPMTVWGWRGVLSS